MTANDLTVLDLLDALLRIDSVNPGLDPGGAGEAPIAAFVAGWGRAAGLRTQVLEGTPGRPSVILRGGRNTGRRRLLLCGHLDIVGLAGTRDALTARVDGDRVYARGAYDMKAGLAAALIARRDAASPASTEKSSWPPSRNSPAWASKKSSPTSTRPAPTPLFRAVSAVRKQLATAEGLIGYTLRAKPLARDYWTLSAWQDDTALRQFMCTPPHVQVMTSLKPFMGPTKFVTWTASAADGRPSMAAALEHLAAG